MGGRKVSRDQLFKHQMACKELSARQNERESVSQKIASLKNEIEGFKANLRLLKEAIESEEDHQASQLLAAASDEAREAKKALEATLKSARRDEFFLQKKVSVAEKERNFTRNALRRAKVILIRDMDEAEMVHDLGQNKIQDAVADRFLNAGAIGALRFEFEDRFHLYLP